MYNYSKVVLKSIKLHKIHFKLTKLKQRDLKPIYEPCSILSQILRISSQTKEISVTKYHPMLVNVHHSINYQFTFQNHQKKFKLIHKITERLINLSAVPIKFQYSTLPSHSLCHKYVHILRFQVN